MADTFNRRLFADCLSKLQSIGPNCWRNNSLDFNRARMTLLKQVAIRDKSFVEYFAYILSDKFIASVNKEYLYNFCVAVSFWVTNCVNLHQYRIKTIEINCKIGSTYFKDLEEAFSGEYASTCFHQIKIFLDSLMDDIKKEGSYLHEGDYMNKYYK